MKSSRMAASGQSLVEALLGLLVLGSLFVLIPLLGRIQDLALQSTFASRYAAFSLASYDVNDAVLHDEVTARFFGLGVQRWLSLGMGNMVDAAGENIDVLTVADGPGGLDARAQIGGTDNQSGTLREELLFRDKGASTSHVSVRPRLATRPQNGLGNPSGAQLMGLQEWAAMKLTVAGSLSLLTDAGQASGDDAVQASIAASDHAWRLAASRSVEAGKSANAALRPLDKPWDRPDVDFDWLRPWTALVPADRLRASGQGAP
jgi:hypothetical protein